MNNDTLITEDRFAGIAGTIGSFTAQVFGWMTLGLMITTAVGIFIAYLANNSLQFYEIISVAVPIVFILELVIVIALSAFWRRFNGLISMGLFFFYSALNGVFIGLIISYYSVESVIFAFAATAVIFLVLTVYGLVTKTDLTRWGNLALFGLLGLIIASVVNIVISMVNPGLGDGIYWITTYVGVAIFLILVAFDAQKLKRLAMEAEQNGEGTLKYSVQGALMLYLDFINIFIRILSITGKRRR